MTEGQRPPTNATPEIILSTTAPSDPPPPYPTPSRDRRSGRPGGQRRRRRGAPHGEDHAHSRVPSAAAEDEEYSAAGYERVPSAGGYESGNEYDGPSGVGASSSDLLQVPTSPVAPPHSPRMQHTAGGGAAVGRRPRTLSMTSTLHSVVSAAPSFAQTVMSAFHPDLDDDLDSDCLEDSRLPPPPAEDEQERLIYEIDIEEDDQAPLLSEHSRPVRRKPWLHKYLRPVFRRAYYSALFHLLIVNFPYALAAWVYLFVFTLSGTTTLMALPVGAMLCFLDLLGARAFARGELSIQTTYHGPLAYPAPYPPHPIFTRVRAPTAEEAETGVDIVYERSFYRNAYAMFTDSTSYQSLFYFLVIKPGVTIFLFLTTIILVPLGFALIIPAPAVLRLIRRLGIWQANLAVEALWLVVR
ncbi:hypothetical protein BXZ70DRAFT_1003120 [Cristinia sonorae]|uniref:Sensor domain-containing protein n=1 Tax=Cristinia sonorae TaxID=1940300 RepID=A0A8K0XUK4_9AGAR|nr:hypothetical protein BXZ70DRAFT_1003120 [Cristinia sonorae]